ncbi:MAG: hypothetical protein HFH68_03055 [Lachnospiraceae bacterium]|nr:hypothetical protein [Lachnospiraceae bacterium]
MNLISFIQTNIFATILTLSVSIANCVITAKHGYRKTKVEKFKNIYTCLENFANTRAGIIDKCNKIADELADALPEKWNKKTSNEWMKKYQDTYNGINNIITEYSKFLDLFLPFSYFLYKNKPIFPVIITECWSILNLYEQLIIMQNNNIYKIKYSQIVSLVQFILLKGKRKDKKKIHEYLKRNQISEPA